MQCRLRSGSFCSICIRNAISFSPARRIISLLRCTLMATSVPGTAFFMSRQRTTVEKTPLPYEPSTCAPAPTARERRVQAASAVGQGKAGGREGEGGAF